LGLSRAQLTFVHKRQASQTSLESCECPRTSYSCFQI